MTGNTAWTDSPRQINRRLGGHLKRCRRFLADEATVRSFEEAVGAFLDLSPEERAGLGGPFRDQTKQFIDEVFEHRQSSFTWTRLMTLPRVVVALYLTTLYELEESYPEIVGPTCGNPPPIPWDGCAMLERCLKLEWKGLLP